MGEDQRRCRSGEDRISGLPDELLHDILVRLRSARAAARTSVLSRRWRHVWAHLPELRLHARRDDAAPASSMDTVDAALDGYLAPTLEYLAVSIFTHNQDRDLRIPAGRIAPWLDFAAEHVVGELSLSLVISLPEVVVRDEEEVVLELPVFERAKQIYLFFLTYPHATWLCPQASGVFRALTFLRIGGYVCMEGSDITALVCTQCPCLRDLSLSIRLIANFDVSIHSNSLRTLVLCVSKARRLEIMAPRLEELTNKYHQQMEAHISAPKLVKLAWAGTYDPHLNQFVDVGRTLKLLKINCLASSLTKRFHQVDELDINIISSSQFTGAATHDGSFLNETNKLPKCKSFSVLLSRKHHAIMPIMLHLLRSCNGTKKFRVQLLGDWSRVIHSCLPSCACRRLEESCKIDGIDLSSLEEVEIVDFLYSHEQMELVEFLSCNAGNLKRLLIEDMFGDSPKDLREKVRSICHPNVKVEYYLFRKGIGGRRP